uniref:Uncharacterized protein n=1 Tax=Oryza nivara TaxID=4536 RepID=A0A0E0GKB9_ORYNI
MEIAGVCDDCACARAVEVRRQEKYWRGGGDRVSDEEGKGRRTRERDPVVTNSLIKFYCSRREEEDEVGNGDEEGGRG